MMIDADVVYQAEMADGDLVYVEPSKVGHELGGRRWYVDEYIDDDTLVDEFDDDVAKAESVWDEIRNALELHADGEVIGVCLVVREG
jgi:hypothetical protein